MQATDPSTSANATSAAKATAIVQLDGTDLPAHCPNVAMPLWSSHPRIFLDLSHGGSATCPYCGTVYQLKPGTVLHGH